MTSVTLRPESYQFAASLSNVRQLPHKPWMAFAWENGSWGEYHQCRFLSQQVRLKTSWLSSWNICSCAASDVGTSCSYSSSRSFSFLYSSTDEILCTQAWASLHRSNVGTITSKLSASQYGSLKNPLSQARHVEENQLGVSILRSVG